MRFEELVRELASVVSLGPTGFADPTRNPATRNVEITDVVHDSRAAAPGAIFCAVPGLTVDGHDFVDAALAQGA